MEKEDKPNAVENIHVDAIDSEGNSTVDTVLKHDHFDQVSLGNDQDNKLETVSRSQPSSQTRHKRNATMPNVSPELLHLVDSAIMGKPESLEKLKSIVSGVETFGNGENDSETIAFLVIDSLIATMGGVESFEEDEDSNPPSVMLNSRAAVVSGELIPSLPCSGDDEGGGGCIGVSNFMSPRTRMVRGLLAILRSCTRNRAMCSTAGLLCVLLVSAEEIMSKDASMKWNASALFHCIQHLAGHSLNVDDLYRWLRITKQSLPTVWLNPLMNALEKAITGNESRGPGCSFEFVGESSGLLGPGENRWPFTNGYAFATWIYIESFADTLNATTAAAAIAAASAAKSGTTSGMSTAEGTSHMPRVFSFLTADNLGIEVYFYAQFLVVECSTGKGSKASLHLTYAFKPQVWYFIGIEHTNNQGLLGSSESEVRLYIDGCLYETRPFEFPRISKPLSSCCIGSNPPSPTAASPQCRRRSQCALFAEMGPVYIFKEPIGPERMSRLSSRGGDVLPCFGNGEDESNVLDANIHLLYHPCLLNGRFCPDASLSAAPGTQRRPAEVIGQVHVAVRTKSVESLSALAYGGPMSLLPLTVTDVDKDSLEPSFGDVTSHSLAAPIFRIISVAIKHPRNNEELSRARGAEVLAKVLSYLLKSIANLDCKQERVGRDEELVSAVVSVCQSEKINHGFKVDLFRTLLLDLKIWSVCNYRLQKKLLSSVQDIVFTEATVMRNADAIQILLDGCRKCYWMVQEKDSVSRDGGDRRHLGEVNALVDELLVIIELLMGAASPSFAPADVHQLLGFIIGSPQPNQVARVLHLMFRLVVQPNASKAKTFAEAFITTGGIETLLVLLQIEAKTGEDNVVESAEQSQNRVSETRCCINHTRSNSRSNVDDNDRVVVGIIRLIGTLISKGHLKFSLGVKSDVMSNLMGSSGTHECGGTMFDDKVALLLYALLKAFQAAPNRLMTDNVYTTLLGASINAASTEDGMNFYDLSHRFEHPQILLILLRSLPFASKALQNRALQDILFLACSHEENRNSLTEMEEWPEWILEILISNYEKDASHGCTEVEDLVHNFLIIMLEHSMRQKDGWKDIEATIHCAEWLSIVGGSSTGEKRIRREESLPILKRRLLGGLLDFSTRELQAQTQVIAAASAGVAAESKAPQDAKAGVENAAQLAVFLVENTIVILMLVEDHLRLQSKQICAVNAIDVAPSPLSLVYPLHNNNNRSRMLTTVAETPEVLSSRASVSSDSGGVHLDVLATMADATGQISTAVMERFAAAAAAEPYESVSCAFVSYGSCAVDLSEGWKYRSRLWFGVGLPPKTTCFGGGGSGWESWKCSIQKDTKGNWIELPLVKKSVSMLQALLLDESGGLGIGRGSGTGMGGMSGLYQLLDSDQPFLCMLRMVLLSMREDDNGEDSMLMKKLSPEDGPVSVNISSHMSPSALLWSVLSPIVNMPISDSKRQRVLVTTCVLYSEVWHAVSRNKLPLRKQYLEAILPPFVAILRRWRPLLAGIHELATADGVNPLVADDRALAGDALPIDAALSMITPEWAAAFASPPSAMALAMIAAGAAGWEAPAPPAPPSLRRDSSLLERKSTKLQTFSSFQKPLEAPKDDDSPGRPRDKAAAKAAALAAARDLERNAKIGSGRGLSAVAMATSSQRRTISDAERLKRWNISEAMGVAWMECLQPVDTKSVFGKDFNALSYKFIAVLVASFALARNMQRSEVDRRIRDDNTVRNRLRIGTRGWRKLIHYLVEMRCFFGPFGDYLSDPKCVFLKLDSIESLSRMRQCLRRNYSGSEHLEAVKSSLPSNTLPILASEAISKEIIYEDDDDDDDNFDDFEVEGNVKEHNEDSDLTGINDHRPLSEQEVVQDTKEVVPKVKELGERIVLEVSSSMIRPLKVVKGTFQITTKRINFLVDVREGHERNRTWLMSSLHQIYSRRYLLRKSALEIFMFDRSNFLFDFGNSEGRRDVYRTIVQAKPPHLNNIFTVTQRPEQLLRRSQLMERWSRWEISNFEYLMQLNTLAGRSYSDITQYFVFPWILSDYTSKVLDLSNPSSYRDLSKPIGALNPERLKKFQEQYSSFQDPIIPKYHYSSHYSSVGSVLHYLARVEPFTTLSIQQQGGEKTRIFSDIPSTWKGVLDETSNVTELVPELFYLPEVLDSVKLPPWAKNPIDFVHKQRMALESDHVSSHLHEWIDLIFGYKQRGKEAITANNVFYYTTYEGTINIDKITDPVKQRSTQENIVSFGQTPSQLLTVPHIKKMPLKDVLHMKTIFRNPKGIKPYPVQAPEHCNLPAAAIKADSESVVIVDMNVPSAHIANHKWQPNTIDSNNINAPFVFQHGKANPSSSGGTLIRMFKGDSEYPQAQAFASSGIISSSVIAITNHGEIITGGHVDNSIKLVSCDDARTIETAFGHCGPVTSLALSSDNNFIVTGSRDTTLMLWRLHSEPECRIEGPIQVFHGHRREITCCAISSEQGIVVSSSSVSSDVLLHSLWKGRVIRRFVGVKANALQISSDGVVVVWSRSDNSIATFTVNGILISKAKLPSSCIISCIELSLDSENVLIGVNSLPRSFEEEEENEEKIERLEITSPSICFLNLYTLKMFHVLKLGEGQDITAMALNNDNTNLLVSTQDKQLIIFTDPSLSSKVAVDQKPKLGSE